MSLYVLHAATFPNLVCGSLSINDHEAYNNHTHEAYSYNRLYFFVCAIFD